MIGRMRSGIAALLAFAACSLISKDITQLPLRLPSKSFIIDATSWHAPAGQVPAVPCATCAAAQPVVCGSAPCSFDCNEGTGNCQATVTLTVTEDYDLTKESSDYRSVGSQSLVSFGVDAVAVNVTQNTLSFATPTMTLYLGPTSATSPADAQAVGTLNAIPAGLTGQFNVAFAAGGQDVVKKYMVDNYKTPFRALVVGTTTLQAGDPSPTGELVGSVVITAHAQLGP
jgi:hypothetical protein